MNDRGYSQLIGSHEHDRVGSFPNSLSAIIVFLAIRSVQSSSCLRSGGQESLWEHILITNYSRPGWVALELNQVVVTRLSIEVQLLCLRSLSINLLAPMFWYYVMLARVV